MKIQICLALMFVLLAMCPGAAQAEPTEIVVRVISKDAKFIGTSVGGTEITMRDAETGELLSQGITMGETGNTPKIMSIPRTARDVISDSEAASFSATLDIDRPRKITVTAVGPAKPGDATVSTSSTQWVVPGKHINRGDAWMIELRGFSVSVVELPPSEIHLDDGIDRIQLVAKVTMLCGCPIVSGGMWDADKIEVGAIVWRNGTKTEPVLLSFSGEANTFEGELRIAEAGEYSVDLYAYDPTNGNTGLANFSFRAL